MMYYTPRSPHYITAGVWQFYPALMFARCMHNGAGAYFKELENGEWEISCWGCPADWMLRELKKWFDAWIQGKVHTNNYKNVELLTVQ